MSTEQTEKCGQYFQADTALCFKCGMPKGHKGSHGWCSQDVLTAARDVAAERITVSPASSSEGASLAVRVQELEGQCRSFREAYDRESQWRATAEQRLAEVTRHLTEAQAAIEKVRWVRVQCGSCGSHYRRCRCCDVGIIAPVTDVGSHNQCGGHQPEPCKSDCLAALAAPAAVTPQQTKDEDDSTRVDSQS